MTGSMAVITAMLCLFVGVQGYPAQVKNNTWDYLLFVERHPPGVCYSQANCFYPANATEWTIHGLWPTDENSEGPNYCNQSAVFDSKILESMWPTLVAEWTNMEPNTAFDSFWSHEYLKHGTCAEVLPDLSTELKFFQTVVRLFEQKFNFQMVLEKAGITPSNSTPYKYDDFDNAFMDYFGVKPFLECSYDKSKGQQRIIQATVCVRKDFSVRDCPSGVYSRSKACWTTEVIYYLSRN